MTKNKNIAVVGFLFILSSTFSHTSLAQGWDCVSSSCNTSKKQWTVNINAGATSYFGDLSIYDQNPFKKIQHESGIALGIIGTRYFNNTFGLSFQLLSGKTSASKNDISFQSSFIEYNVHGRVNLLRLLNKSNDSKIKWDVYAGAGQFFFKTTKSIGTGPDSTPFLHQTQVPEFIYFFGSGLSYPITSCLSLTTDLALRQSQTDRLDDFINNKDFDYYTYLSFGITINLGELK